MSEEKVIVVEDEADILEVISHNLTREGYRVISVKDGLVGLRKIRAEAPNLILLDLMLPSLDGIELCKRLKADPLTRSIPVIMVTAKDGESDVVLGLGVGADDYIRKPFSPRELVARVKAVMRRGELKEEREAGERIAFQGLLIDSVRHEVLVDDKAVPFTATEFRLLFLLASNPGRAFTREGLLNRVIGNNVHVLDRNIDVHVRSVRKKLGEHRNYIETVRGVGYRFRDIGE